jgi:hypothetical protein
MPFSSSILLAVSCQDDGPESIKVFLIGVEVLLLKLLYRDSRSGT